MIGFGAVCFLVRIFFAGRDLEDIKQLKILSNASLLTFKDFADFSTGFLMVEYLTK